MPKTPTKSPNPAAVKKSAPAKKAAAPQKAAVPKKAASQKADAGKGAIDESSAAKKAAPRKKTAAKADGKGSSAKGKPNALQQPLQLSNELAAITGAKTLSRAEVISKVWAYIKANNLQNPENRQEIIADEKLKSVLGTDKVTMFEMNKHLSQHMK